MNSRWNNLVFRIAFVLGIAAMIWAVNMKDTILIVVIALSTASALSMTMFIDKIEQKGWLLPTVVLIFTLSQAAQAGLYGYKIMLDTTNEPLEVFLASLVLVPIFFAYQGGRLFANMLYYPN